MTRSQVIKFSAAIVALALAACTRVPELEDQLSADLKSADYPKLVPLDRAVEPLPLPSEQSEELEKHLKARNARLKARAQALNSLP